jgi:hypothetical protein
MDTQSCKETYIAYIQCKNANLAREVVKSAQYGKDNLKCLLTKLKIIHSYLDILYRYRVFQEEVTYAYSVTIENEEGNSVTIGIAINGVDIGSYTGEGDGTSIVSALKSYINENTSVPEYYAEANNSTLYIYSYAGSGVSYTYEPVLSGITEYSVSSLEEEEEIILNFWNCLTNEEIDNIINHSLNILENYSTDNTGGVITDICKEC